MKEPTPPNRQNPASGVSVEKFWGFLSARMKRKRHGAAKRMAGGGGCPLDFSGVRGAWSR